MYKRKTSKRKQLQNKRKPKANKVVPARKELRRLHLRGVPLETRTDDAGRPISDLVVTVDGTKKTVLSIITFPDTASEGTMMRVADHLKQELLKLSVQLVVCTMRESDAKAYKLEFYEEV